MQRLIESLGSLPGIGPKTAERLAHHLLAAPAEEVEGLACAIRDVKHKLRHCGACYNLAEGDTCEICRDPRRDAGVILVVETPKDLMVLEAVGSYRGLYHVLGGRIAPLDGIGPDQLTIDPLLRRVRAGGVREVILGTNPNLEGDGTALFLSNRLQGSGVSVTRLARGLASGGSIDLSNREMLADALEGRRKVSE